MMHDFNSYLQQINAYRVQNMDMTEPSTWDSALLPVLLVRWYINMRLGIRSLYLLASLLAALLALAAEL